MASSKALSALDIVLQQWFQTEYNFGPSAAEFRYEAKTVFALKKTCSCLNAHDSLEWELGSCGVCFSFAEAVEEARIVNPQAIPSLESQEEHYNRLFPPLRFDDEPPFYSSDDKLSGQLSTG